MTTPSRHATPPTLDRDLLRAAGEHLGTLAEQEYEALAEAYKNDRKTTGRRAMKLSRLSREVLEIANG